MPYQLALAQGDGVAAALVCGQVERVAAVTQVAHAARTRGDDSLLELASRPRQAHAKVATGTQSADAALGPRVGQRGQQVETTGMALQQHFSYTGRAAKVAINLEGGMNVPQIVGRAVLQQITV